MDNSSLQTPTSVLALPNGHAAYQVLTQPQLLLLVTSFQRGLPIVTGPLIYWYLSIHKPTAMALDFESVCALWEKPHPKRLVSPLRHRATSKLKWRERVTAEAIAKYDTETMDALHYQIDNCASSCHPEKARQRCVHLLWESAASFGRVDILTYLCKVYHASIVEPLALAQYAASLAVRQGQLAVLDWLEATFGETPLAKLREFNLKTLVFHGHRDTVRWMTERHLGVMPIKAAVHAISHHDVVLLNAVIDYRPSPMSPWGATRVDRDYCLELLVHAVFVNHWDGFVSLVQRNWPFPLKMLAIAVTQRKFTAIQCMLDHLPHATHDPSGRFRVRKFMKQLVENDDVQVLEMVITSVEPRELHHTFGGFVRAWSDNQSLSEQAIALLLRVSSTHDIATVLLQYALRRHHDGVHRVLALVDRPLPPDVVSFAHRAATGTLGPVASLADAYDCQCADAHLVETMVHHLATASRDDVRDTVLRLLSTDRTWAIGRILKADAVRVDGACCDDAFLEQCTRLTPEIYHSGSSAVAEYLEERCELQGVYDACRRLHERLDALALSFRP